MLDDYFFIKRLNISTNIGFVKLFAIHFSALKYIISEIVAKLEIKII
jgi:hypothetical protein